MSEFFAMDGYAAFLWPSYLITFVAIVANIVIALKAHASARAAALRRLEGDPAGTQT
ncbi:MAG: heme exporter protein CcmD [Gammaproteobacteria bacterium]|nr:heme exporter protein CcmD [Gammaproteobacteria bacterium]